MFDLLLDSNNDLYINEKGDLDFTTTTQQELQQRLSIRLLTYQGEWFLNELFGVPYLQQIIGVAKNKSTVDTIMRAEIAEETGTSPITSFVSDYSPYDRSYILNVTINTDEGVINIDVNNKPVDQWIYSLPPTPVSVDCSEKIDITNTLFEFVNIEGLPYDTYSTWYNMWVQYNYITYGNSLYSYNNNDLPETGSSTWINLWD